MLIGRWRHLTSLMSAVEVLTEQVKIIMKQKEESSFFKVFH
jgi:hypothetical protein